MGKTDTTTNRIPIAFERVTRRQEESDAGVLLRTSRSFRRLASKLIE
ncbi:MAG: hypothetical protein HQK89_04980 [Nitrospirae bacterium]|nr:hypothetical protein [Nitrospirota bacterium]